MRAICSALVIAGALTFHAGAALAGAGGGGGTCLPDADGDLDLCGVVTPPDLPGLLSGVCGLLGVSSSCPAVPTVSGILLPVSGILVDIAALSNANPGSVRAQALVANVDPFLFPPQHTASAVNRPLGRESGIDLSDLTPIAFISGFAGLTLNPIAAATHLGDPEADSFFYAVTTGKAGGQPDTLALFYDYLPQTQNHFTKGQILGDIFLPLVVLSGGNENANLADLQISAACTGGPACLRANIIFGGQPPRSAAEVGVQFGFGFGPSPNSAVPHATYEVQIPLLVTMANDPAYFGVTAGKTTGVNQISGFPTAFSTDVRGFTPAFLGVPIGVAPVAAEFTASFSKNGNGVSLPAVAVFLAIGTDGTSLSHVPLECAFSESCSP